MFWNVARMPEACPRWAAGTEFMMAVVFGGTNTPMPTPLRKISDGEGPVAEVGRQQHQEQEGQRGEQHPAGGEARAP